MSRYDSIDDTALWASIIEIQTNLESGFRTAVKSRRLVLLGDMSASLRQMHWAAAFLGITSLADIAAAGAAFVEQLQDSRYQWSVELGAAMKSLLKRTRAFCDARPEEPSAGVFIDSDEAVLQGPELKRTVPVDDLLSLYRRRQIDISRVSGCKQISVGQDPAFSHAITVPKSARARHNAAKNLTLVYLDLDDQEKTAQELAGLFESAWLKNEILLHGPLAIPWKNYKSYKGTRPYYLLLDTTEQSEDWLKDRGINGRIIKELKAADETAIAGSVSDMGSRPIAPITETKVIIREVPVGGRFQGGVPGGSVESAATIEEIEAEEKKNIKRLRHQPDKDIKYKVGTKLIIMVSGILIVALGVTSVVGVLIFRQNLSSRLEISSTSMTSIVAKQAENEIFNVINSANLLFQVGSAPGSQGLVDDFFANAPGLIYVGIPDSPYQHMNRSWFRNNRIFDEQTVLNGILDARVEDLDKARNGETVVINVSPLIPNLESPVLAIAVPFQVGNSQESLVILTDIGETLIESVRLQQGDTTTAIINPDGEILAHPDLNNVFDGVNITGNAAYEKMYTEELGFGIIEYSEETDEGPKAYLGYYKLLGNPHLGVITTILRSDAYGDISTMIRLNLYFGLTILALSIVGIMMYARTITVPIQRLYIATRRIRAQAWERAAVTPKYKDEIGALSKKFTEMIPDLRATADLMDQTRAFVNEEVANMIYHRTLPDYAETKDVTVFFSDVRGFTSKSEAMGDPQIVMTTLSKYFEAMVPCVKNTGGTVDKFIGDALMAVWGSTGNALPNHAESAVDAALKMRDAIMEFNKDRDPDDPFNPTFQIGCGLHSGDATVGLMGSSTKQEWAHMGSTVNLASRIEGANAKEGTDILISPETARRVNGIYHLMESRYDYDFKGVSGKTRLYIVLGRMDEPGRPRTLEELRKRLGRPIENPEEGGAGGKFKTSSR